MQRKEINTNMEILEKSSLFSGLEGAEIKKLLTCTQARQEEYEKGETLIWEGEAVTEIGIVLSGRGRTIKTDASGKILIISLLGEGSFIGVLLAASQRRKSPVTVQAAEHLTVLFMPFDRVIERCAASCPRHDILLRNCFNSIAEKSMSLYDRIECIIRPTVREKVLSYLKRLSNEEGSNVFMVPLDRNEMAEYLNVERSALSRELSKMKSEGLIDYYKSSFKLINGF